MITDMHGESTGSQVAKIRNRVEHAASDKFRNRSRLQTYVQFSTMNLNVKWKGEEGKNSPKAINMRIPSHLATDVDWTVASCLLMTIGGRRANPGPPWRRSRAGFDQSKDLNRCTRPREGPILPIPHRKKCLPRVRSTQTRGILARVLARGSSRRRQQQRQLRFQANRTLPSSGRNIDFHTLNHRVPCM